MLHMLLVSGKLYFEQLTVGRYIPYDNTTVDGTVCSFNTRGLRRRENDYDSNEMVVFPRANLVPIWNTFVLNCFLIVLL
jgi:hypothetical protein